MSYLRKFEYEIIPEESYTIIRRCPICGIKTSYNNSNNFRVNANGNRIDVWLIYQCNKCKHTYNLTILDRWKKEDLSPQQYKSFMESDKELAMNYGMDKSIFSKNKAEIDKNGIKYQTIPKNVQKHTVDKQTFYLAGDLIEVRNPYELKIRTDKMISEILQISRTKATQLEISGVIHLNHHPGQNLELLIKGNIYNEI